MHNVSPLKPRRVSEEFPHGMNKQGNIRVANVEWFTLYVDHIHTAFANQRLAERTG
jgi:hypothetical protein